MIQKYALADIELYFLFMLFITLVNMKDYGL